MGVSNTGPAAPQYFANLAAADGTQINLAYNVGEDTDGSSGDSLATDGRLTVKGDGWDPSDKVRAVVIDNLSGGQQDVRQIDLTAQPDGSFAADVPDLALDYWNAGGEHDVNSQELAIVHNGEWLEDPVSASHNFKLNLKANVPD